MSRSHLTGFMAVWLSVAVVVASCAVAQPSRRPNVVVFLVDDLGADELNCYASKFHETPNIDALASRGMRFTQAYSASTLCSPSRAALLTGRSPARLHLTDWIPGQPQINRRTLVPPWQTWIDRERVLLPEAMQEHGYATCFLGKWHLIPRPKPTERNDSTRVAELQAIYRDHLPENNGFDENFGGDHSPNQGGRFLFPAYQTLPGLNNKGSDSDCLTDVLTDCAVDFVERKQHEPFFLYLSYYTVHTPITGKQAYVKKYEQKRTTNPDANYYMNNPGKAAMIQSLDESVGRVLSKLAEVNQLDNTLVVFTGDNGSQGNEFVINYRGNKGTAYEGGTRVPLIVAGPRIVSGTTKVPSISMDLYPTILSYIGAPLKPNEHLDGLDIMPLLTGQGTIADRPLYWHYPHYDESIPYSSAIIDGWKVIRYPGDGKVELFNLREDPMETSDRASIDPTRTRNMVNQLDRLLTAVQGQRTSPNPDFDATAFSGGIRDFRIWDQGQKDIDGGFHTFKIWSPHQARKTNLRVLLPDSFDLRKTYRVLYVLPVQKDEPSRPSEGRHGDGLVEIKKHNLHNQHQLICVAPGYTSNPWYADHDLNPRKQDESHLLRTVIPFIEKRYPVQKNAAGRLLIGFSKSGWGAATLLLRNPSTFHRAAVWDAGVRVDTGPMREVERDRRISRDWGSAKNFESYRLSNLIKTRGKALGSTTRLFYFNVEGPRATGSAAIHRLLVKHEVPHHYVTEPHRRHAWDSGWLPASVACLASQEMPSSKLRREDNP